MVTKGLLLAVVVSCFCGLVVTHNKFFMEVNQKCKEENQLTPEEFAHVMNRSARLETENQRVKCFVKCAMTMFKAMTEDGEFVPIQGLHKLPQYDTYFSNCKDTTGTDLCDKAVNFRNCMVEKMNTTEEIHN